MGADITVYTEVKNHEGKWIINNEIDVFSYRDYGMFAFLAGVRNLSNITPISEPRGLPDDSEWLNEEITDSQEWCFNYSNQKMKRKDSDEINWNESNHSYLTLRELLDFNYNQTFEDKRDYDNSGTLEGVTTTYKEFLGDSFFRDLEKLKTLGKEEDVRIIFWFG